MKEFTPTDGFFAIGGLEALLVLVVAATVLIGFIFWLWMVVDCLTKEASEGNDKLIWGLIVFFGHLLGAIVYFFARRPERIRTLGR